MMNKAVKKRIYSMFGYDKHRDSMRALAIGVSTK
jgi:hypothetical protein